MRAAGGSSGGVWAAARPDEPRPIHCATHDRVMGFRRDRYAHPFKRPRGRVRDTMNDRGLERPDTERAVVGHLRREQVIPTRSANGTLIEQQTTQRCTETRSRVDLHGYS